MVESIPMDPYEPNEITPTGQTLLAPPEGTVRYGVEPFLYAPGESEGNRAGEELESPLESTPEVLAEGQEVFETFCVVCHGPLGAGDGPVVGPEMFSNPPNLMAAKARRAGDGLVYHLITYGRGQMPPYAVQVLPRERWAAIHYLRKLQSENPVAPTTGETK